MPKIPVIFCFDDRILLGAGVTILSMLDSANAATDYDIHIFNPGFSDSIKADLSSLVHGTRHTLTCHEIATERFDNVPKNRGSWTEIVYFRLLACEVLKDCDKAIYSDVDVFFKRDMAEVFNTDLTDIEWGGVAAEANTPDTIMHRHFPENPKDRIYFSGFMVMNLALMRQNAAVKRYFDTIEEFKERLKFFDLDLLNIATPKIAAVPFDYVVLEDVYEIEDVTQAKDYAYLKSVYSAADLTAARDATAIVHFAGPRGKPWQRQDVPAYYTAVAKRLPKGLRKVTFRDWRKKWLSKKGRATLVTRPHNQ